MDNKTRVLSTIEAMTTALNRGGIEAIMRAYEPDALVVGEPVSVQGDGPLRAMFARFIAAKAHFTSRITR